LLVVFANAHAQTPRISHSVSTLIKQNTYLGRELWFSMCENADLNNSGQFYYLYVTSPNNTIVNIEIPGHSTIVVPLTPGMVHTESIPVDVQMNSSGVVEHKAIHVWSATADISGYLLSRNEGSTDGMFIIPTTGWGTTYVVASFGGLIQGYSGPAYDYPSEFSIVSNQAGTICTIIPNCDIRESGNKDVVLHAAGVPFTEYLELGQCVQYQAIVTGTGGDDNVTDYDFTGTIITSNKPVGVVGASQCSDIPADYQYCDHLCDMIPPVRTWANTYQTVNFAGRSGKGDTYLMIGTKAGQEIYRNGPTNRVTALTSKYGFFYDESGITGPSQWTSTDPFLLVQYLNGSTWVSPDGSAPGDPAMVVINSVEQYPKQVVFQTPSIPAFGGFSFANYVNVMVDSDAVKYTTFDTIPITSNSSKNTIPNSRYISFTLSSVKPGTHVVNSDSGVGVYIYGYGDGESYAWSGALGLRTVNDPDTIPPRPVVSGDCFAAHVSVTDTSTAPPASLVSEMKLDSLYNMNYTPDANYQIGIAASSTFYSMNVIDSTKPAYLKIEVHDFAGNQTFITSTYQPQTASLSPTLLNFGSGTKGVQKCQYISITNTGTVPYTWNVLKLASGNVGFAIDSIGSNSAIPPGGARKVLVCFTPPTLATQSDTLILSDGCSTVKTTLIGTGGQADFSVTDEDFGCRIVGLTTKRSDAIITNVSKSSITIDSIWINPSINFGYDPVLPGSNAVPFSIAPNAQHPIEFSFIADKVGSFIDTAHFHSPGIGWKTALLQGCGIAPGAHLSGSADTITDCGTGISFPLTIQSTGGTGTTIDSIIVQGGAEFQLSDKFTGPGGNPLGQLPVSLLQGGTFIAYLNFIPPPKASGIYTAIVFAISDMGDTTNIDTIRVRTVYRELAVAKRTVHLPVQPYGGALVPDTLVYCNDLTDSVRIDSVNAIPGPYTKVFRITGYLVGGTSRQLPLQLYAGECLTVTGSFDPSFYSDSVQFGIFSVSSNACVTLPADSVMSGVSVGSPAVQGFTLLQPIISCDTKTQNVTVTNSNLPATLPMKILSVAIAGPDTGIFVPSNSGLGQLPGGSTSQIPITFKPLPSPVLRTYRDTAIITLLDATGNKISLKAPISASAGGMNAFVSSILGVQSADPNIQNTVDLPINISLTKNGITNDISDLGIKKITLQYQYNADLLEPKRGGTVSGAYNSANGWAADPSSAVDASGILTLTLTNTTALNDAMTSLGSISFYPTLTKEGTKSTPISLIKSEFFVSDSSPVGNCLSDSLKGTQFSLVYSCGDSALAYFLRYGNAPSMMKPVNPNPISLSTGNLVSFEYVTKHEGTVSLVLFDELGREAVRIIDRQYLPAGTYQSALDIRKLTSGSYIYRFQLDGNRAISGKLVVDN
jgi:hypothetical protein